MTSDISRNIIIDLLPAYLSGEASKETRLLVESYAKDDPDIRAMIASGTININSAPPVTADVELKSLQRTRRRVARQAWHLGFAMLFTLLIFTYQFGPHGFLWTWRDFPYLSGACVVLALIFWGAYFESRRRTRLSDGKFTSGEKKRLVLSILLTAVTLGFIGGDALGLWQIYDYPLLLAGAALAATLSWMSLIRRNSNTDEE